MPEYDGSGFAPPAPVARVVLRHPESGASLIDVRMLIDSGADATLLPDDAVTALGLIGTGERYALEAFDGTTHESEAVHAVLIFLGKSFRGRFLRTESGVGIIGRNILNHVRLLLDGPALSWAEWPAALPESADDPRLSSEASGE